MSRIEANTIVEIGMNPVKKVQFFFTASLKISFDDKAQLFHGNFRVCTFFLNKQ